MVSAEYVFEHAKVCPKQHVVCMVKGCDAVVYQSRMRSHLLLVHKQIAPNEVPTRGRGTRFRRKTLRLMGITGEESEDDAGGELCALCVPV
jgi:hypothetical protein